MVEITCPSLSSRHTVSIHTPHRGCMRAIRDAVESTWTARSRSLYSISYDNHFIKVWYGHYTLVLYYTPFLYHHFTYSVLLTWLINTCPHPQDSLVSISPTLAISTKNLRAHLRYKFPEKPWLDPPLQVGKARRGRGQLLLTLTVQYFDLCPGDPTVIQQ